MHNWFLDNAWLIPAIPAVSFLVILLFGKQLPRRAADLVGVPAVGASFLLACATAVAWINRSPVGEGEERLRPYVERGFTWWQGNGIKFQIGIHIDGLAVMMLFVVTLVSLLVHIFSVAYMHDDRRYVYYYAALSLFTASMLFMVEASGLLQLLVGWELVGVCSFMLIGHWWEEQPNSNAALKAFFTTRTGDVGLMIGIIILFFAAGQTFNIQTINTKAVAGQIPHYLLVVGAVTLFMGTIGKSAQFPLHTWLPDAMAGPTPVSALIHAATMVVAGVYLVARTYGVFWAGLHIAQHTSSYNIVAIIGAITIIIAAALAFVQSDIKKVLAYSTVSQLGYMVMALGVGAWTAAIFHLFTHAFFKADLFLGAGSVSHSGSHHSFNMKKDMGGLRKYMPITHGTFVIGSLALAGIFPLAGFWSKDEILVTAGHNGYRTFMIVGLVGAGMTAAYMARCVWLTFYGEYRGGHSGHSDQVAHEAAHALAGHDASPDPTIVAHVAHEEPHESEAAITGPLIVLSFLSIVAGFLSIGGVFRKWTANDVVVHAMATAHVTEAKFSVPAAVISVTIAVLAGGIAWAFYQYHAFGWAHGLAERSRPAHVSYQFLHNKYDLDDLYENVIVGSIKGPIAQAAYWFNQNVIDWVVNAAGVGSRYVAEFVYRFIDQRIVDGAVNGSGFAAEEGGGLLRRMQTGNVQRYAALFFGVGVVLLGVGIVTLT
jgi:NADH-quinone oxidoreductase subunit L